MNPPPFDPLAITRRHFFARTARGLGAMALAGLLPRAAGAAPERKPLGGLPGFPNFTPKAKRIIYLFQSGAPSQMDLFDYKPLLNKLNGEQLPDEVRGGQRLTGMTAQQASIPLAGSVFEFKQHGKSGLWLSELLPHTAKLADDLCLIRSMHTEPINHDPAVTFFGTGNQQPGRPTMGSWITYGLGSENANLPGFVVLLSGAGGQSLQARYWGNGFLPGNYQGVQFRGAGDPVLYLSNPKGIDSSARRKLITCVVANHACWPVGTSVRYAQKCCTASRDSPARRDSTPSTGNNSWSPLVA